MDGVMMDMSLSKLWEMVKGREAWRTTVHGVTDSDTTVTEQQKLFLKRAKVSCVSVQGGDGS